MARDQKTPAKSAGRPPNDLLGGRFSGRTNPSVAQINLSLPVDKKLALEDLATSRAHAAMLGETGIISRKDAEILFKGLQKIEKEIGEGSFVFDETLEDIHMNVEARLHELVGEVAGRLHTARSRNDQVATDLRLWIRTAIEELDAKFAGLQRTIIDLASQHTNTLMPGFTHGQAAQPITFGHHLMAYYEMARRDRGRLEDCRKRLNECPLGAAALAGTAFPIDRQETARALEFDAPMANSIDAVSARDFALEFLAAIAIAAVHLSRLAEEIILWASPAFGFIRLPDSVSTGSSIMPQKKNPDGAELVRAKSASLTSNLVHLMGVMKGLPLAYAKDLQEDKVPVFDSAETLALCLEVITALLNEIEIETDNMGAMAGTKFITATDAADWLVRELDLPFRQAYRAVREFVSLAESKGIDLPDLTIEDLRSVEPGVNETIFDVLSPERSANSRTSYGGTSPEIVRAAIKKALEELK
jgi:argininosuccinate lyase